MGVVFNREFTQNTEIWKENKLARKIGHVSRNNSYKYKLLEI